MDLLNGAGLLTDHDLYLLRLRECDRYLAGFEGDVNDGATTGHPDADFCSVWKPYYDRCLSQLPANEAWNRWAALMWRNRAAFDQIIGFSDASCSGNAMLAFLEQRSFSEEALDFVGYALDLMIADQEIKWDRLEELYDLVEDDPNALIGNCDPHYSSWTDLANFVPSGSVLQRIQNSNGTWTIQSIQNSNGTRINMDEFSVLIQVLPAINGQQISGKQLLDYIRININDFAPTFTPYDHPYDTDLWNSDNPLSSILKIDMSAAESGDVITSQYLECCWIFTTLKGHFWGSGFHPVSGNRQFGYRATSQGIEIYTKGVDRTTLWHHGLFNSSIAFSAADALWTGFQNNIIQYVNSNGGQAGFIQPTKKRPKWNEIRELLKSASPITFIPCD